MLQDKRTNAIIIVKWSRIPIHPIFLT